MPLIYNGTTVTAVTYNGTSVQTLIYNGETVFSAIRVWSGSSTAYTGGVTSGIETSGNAYRSLNGTLPAGGWLYADGNGPATGSSTASAEGLTLGFSTTPTSLVFIYSAVPVTGAVSYNPSTYFSGSSLGTYVSEYFYGQYGYETSSGMLRWHLNSNGTETNGAWITLS